MPCEVEESKTGEGERTEHLTNAIESFLPQKPEESYKPGGG